MSAPQTPKVFSVSELTQSVRKVLESEIGQVCVEGEISNHKLHGSGHQYFTLKDAKSQIACVWFAARSGGGRGTRLTDGMQVQVRGGLTVYESQGKVQINVQSVQAAGAGLLQAKFEALKQRLMAEGLFDLQRKRPLPRFPQTVALVTSPSGAAVQDMLHVLGRRAPWVRVLILPARVQGEGAAEEVAAGIAFINAASGNALPRVDVIIAGRGGGSIEDLWCFNEEVVARAIHASAIPVISAVGHETDTTIADFVADHRAPTPSAAAEVVAPDAAALLAMLKARRERMEHLAGGAVRRLQQQVALLERSALFREPQNRLAEAAQRVDGLAEDLERGLRGRLESLSRKVEGLFATVRSHRPDQVLALRRQQLEGSRERLSRAASDQLREAAHQVRRVSQMLVLLSPEGTLQRGYSIALAPDGSVIRSTAQAHPGMPFEMRVSDGRIRAVVAGDAEKDSAQ